ncbi:FAD-dependent oxidoreductase [Massilia atriviolacea]|uniref:NADH dehydrogenase FAD-containing subunit n=1 Tax=Massilia atriviolacea TaxID=2495579 RepID=A0A430HGE8_9BURK|nr:FAD-dependent oxidoreductase [Massilia atriviolacea]RSZ56624.1 NADH dehydrogenase FAD-containing subunit [Massilia atriviolacea]
MDTIVIVGGGAGGLELATRLGNSAGKAGRARVVLVDRWPTHFWKPLLHTVASGKHDPQVMAIDYAAQAAEHGFEFARGEVLGVDRDARRISLAPWIADDGAEVLPARSLGYDKLVLALGSVTNYFGVPGAERHVLTLDDVAQAETFRQRFVAGCIQASARQAAGAQDPGIDIVIVGGGATGVELAAELSHSARTLAKYNVHALDPVRHVRIRILERGSLLLPHLHPRLSKRAARHLRALGIKVLTDTAVARVDAGAVVDTEGCTYPSAITLWAAGVEAPPLCATLGLSTNRLRQIAVAPSLQALEDPDVYAIGDCANFVCPILGKVPPRAQAAHQQALYLAQALGQVSPPAAPFAYRDYGSLVSLGPLAAVGVLTRSSGQKYAVGGAVARLLYALLYRKHQMALHGVLRMSAQTVADWIRDKLMPSVRLH